MCTINQLPDPFPPTLPGPRVKKTKRPTKIKKAPYKTSYDQKKSMGGRNKTMTTDDNENHKNPFQKTTHSRYYYHQAKKKVTVCT